LTTGELGVAVRLIVTVPPLTATCVFAWAPAGYCASPDHFADIDQVPAVVGVQLIWQLPEAGTQVCVVNVEPGGPEPVTVTSPSLAGTERVAVSTVTWPTGGAGGFAVSVIVAVAGFTVN
jgi:hypothetical protein